jgi:hypothetical protein
MADQQAEPAVPVSNVKLPVFWPNNPEDWFGLAEAQFHVRRVVDDTDKFYHVVSLLPEPVVKMVSDLIRTRPPPDDAYVQLRARLLASHTLTEFQRIEKLQRISSLGGQRPTEMLADLVQLCPTGETGTKLFRIAFLQRLPRELRVILAEDTTSTLPALAARADLLWAHNSLQPHDQGYAVAAIPPPDGEAPVAAVASQQQPRGGGGNRGFRQRGGRGRGGNNGGGSQPAGQMNPSGPLANARTASGLCNAHWKYGDQAWACKQPCTWTGN